MLRMSRVSVGACLGAAVGVLGVIVVLALPGEASSWASSPTAPPPQANPAYWNIVTTQDTVAILAAMNAVATGQTYFAGNVAVHWATLGAFNQAVDFKAIRPTSACGTCPTGGISFSTGVTAASLGNAITDPGFGSATQTQVSGVMTKPAVSEAVETDIGRAIDPAYEGAQFTWLEAEPLETYATYVARLRVAGWLGQAVGVNLDANASDPDYGPGGVPCTSVAGGSIIGTGTQVAFYVNASSFDEEGLPAGDVCGGTTRDDQCDFPGVSWCGSVIQSNLPFYVDACEEAWAYLRANNIVGANDKLAQAYVESASFLLSGEIIPDSRAPDELWPVGSGYTMQDWEKARTEIFWTPHPFRVDFYRLVDRSGSAAWGMKVKFSEFFEP